MLRIIGDVHGKYEQYFAIAKNSEYSVQIGDFGFHREWVKLNYSGLSTDKHKVIAGNHDDYDIAPSYGNYLGNYGEYTLNGVKFFFVRGGLSIDRCNRLLTQFSTREKTYWSQEELNLVEMMDCLRVYQETKPDIVLTHVPCSTFSKVMSPDDSILQRYRFHLGFKENHQLLGDEMLKLHEPKIWISGHFHQSYCWKNGRTTFIGLDELEYVDLNSEGHLSR
jgi:predicted phosphodiesterase